MDLTEKLNAARQHGMGPRPPPWPFLLFATACATPSSSVQVASPPAGPGIALSHVTVVDVPTGALQPSSTVVIRGNRITAVGPDAAIRVPAGVRRLDARGKYVIPGLTDTHVHFFSDDWIEGPVDTAAYFQWIVAGGVTSVREMSADGFKYLPLRSAIAGGRLLGPRIYLSAGPMAGSTEPWQLIFDRLGTRDRQDAIARFSALQVDGLKLMHGAGRDEMIGIVTQARAAGVPVYGHTVQMAPNGRFDGDFDNFTMDLVRAGLNGVVHSTGTVRPPGHDDRPPPTLPRTTPEGRRDWVLYNLSAWESTRDGDIQALIDTMVARRVWYEPTRLVTYYWNHLPEYDRSGLSPHHRWSKDPADATTGRFLQIALQHEAAEARFIRRYHDAGGTILAGTDEVPFPPYGVTEELRLLVAAGLSPLAALQAATVNAARGLGWEDRLGSVAAGKLADLVVLDDNPLENIANLRRVHAVVLDGRLLDRAMLDEFLKRVGTPINRTRGGGPAP